MGGTGCISVTANVAPVACAVLHRAWDAGDLGNFARLRDLLDPLHAALFALSNPISLKAALAELELCSDAMRLPLTRGEPATAARLRMASEAVSAARPLTQAASRFAMVG